MSRKQTKIVKELDPQDIEGFSKARIEHYLRLGYKPYLDEKSEVKWLTEARKNMQEAGKRRPSIAQRIAAHNAYKRHRRFLRRGSFWGFLRAYWLFFALLTCIAILLASLLLNPHFFF